jgi:hypothetical protein
VGTSKITGEEQGSHNKPIGRGAFGAYAPGPDNDEEDGGQFIVKEYHTLVKRVSF